MRTTFAQIEQDAAGEGVAQLIPQPDEAPQVIRQVRRPGLHGGDAGLRDSMYRMQADNSEMLQQQYGGPSPEMIDYIRRANAVSSS